MQKVCNVANNYAKSGGGSVVVISFAPPVVLGILFGKKLIFYGEDAHSRLRKQKTDMLGT